ncbi:hypothetical protein JL722_6287 [Aureococcus anophagefferens]|nr:hypothetical protein JL722_6287 [Aureococcus anophagefferens]
MRWVAWAAALPLVARAGTITADEARCIVDGKTTIFFGDSLTRFCYYEFNTFLSTGAVRDHELGASSGDGRWSDDYDDWEEWTEEGICGAGGKHRRRIWMDLDETTRTEFYFINNVWYAEEDMDKDGDTSLADVAEVAKDAADVVVYNMGWWQLKDCWEDYMCGAEGFDETCAAWYEGMMQEVLDNLLAFDDDVVGIYRTTACCGESHFGDNYNSLGTVTDGWVPAIEAQNAKATAMMEAAGVPVVDVYPFYNISSVDDYTFDSRHATVATCHVWTEMILRAIDRAQGTGCVADLGADYVPEFVFDRWPSPGADARARAVGADLRAVARAVLHAERVAADLPADGVALGALRRRRALGQGRDAAERLRGSSCADLAYWGCDCAGCVCALDGTDGDATVVDKKQGAAPAPTAAAASSCPGDDDEDGKGDDDVWSSWDGDKRRRLAGDSTEYGYHWNVDVADGVDDVSFVHAVVAAVAEDYAVAADRPVIALGFSNGAGMSELLGCHSSYDLWSKYSDCPEWNAVGSEDWFLDTIGTDGVLAQFEASRDAAGCPEEAASRDGECYEYASCPSLGRLCVWDGVGHAITDATTEAAWTYLTGGGACAPTTAAPSSLPGSKKSSDAADAASLGAESLYALAAVLALLILAAVAYRLSRTRDSAPFAPPSPPPLPVEDVAAVAVREFAVEFDDTPTKACKKAFLGDDADAPAETPAAACLGEPLDTQVTTGSEIHPAEPASPGVAGWAKTLELGDGDAPEEPAGVPDAWHRTCEEEAASPVEDAQRALDAALERASSLGDLDPEAPEGDAEAADARDIAGDVAKALLDEEAAAD